MAETLFYHLERRSLDDVLPGLLLRTLERGQRALVRPDTAERAAAIDQLLWTFDDHSFLAHAQAGEGDAAVQPVLISLEEGNANGADIVFFVGGAVPAAWQDAGLSAMARIVMMFDGRDDEQLNAARAAWKSARDAGHAVTYWKESPNGKFEKQS